VTTHLFAEQVSESALISTYLANPQGAAVTEYEIEPGASGFRDILFKYDFPENYKGYVSWVFEVSDPENGLNSQMIFEGALPPIIHWDGMFSNEESLKLNQKYYMRLLLVMPGNKVVSSPWGFFVTIPKARKGAASKDDYISLYVVPTGGLYYLRLKTPSYSSSLYPSFLGDLRLIYKDQHTFGFRFEATCNTIFGYGVSETSFLYSDFSLFYRYHILGAPIRAPTLGMNPTHLGFQFKESDDPERYGQRVNVQLGARLTNTVLRGFASSSIDNELARVAQGLLGTAHVDYSLWAFRLHGALEAGYSFFKGGLMMASGEAGITYQWMTNIAPGFQLRYQILKGTAAGDQPNAGLDINNQILFAGLILYFKI